MKETLIGAINLALKTNKTCINVSISKTNKQLCGYLFKSGLINSFVLNKSKNKIIVFLSLFYEKRPICEVKKISNPGSKRYITYLQLKKISIYRNHFLILSTNKGILNNKEAILQKTGGELLFLIT